MQTLRLKVDEDGHVAIPDTQPGQTVTVQVMRRPDEPPGRTLTTARTDEERAAIAAEILRAARELRAELDLDPEERLSITHGDLLYDEDGLPK